MQYDATTYGSKINWIYVFANHKGTTCMLNALVLILESVHSKKICGFINCSLSLICMYVHQDVRVLKFKECNFSFVLTVFKINKIIGCCCKCFFVERQVFF